MKNVIEVENLYYSIDDTNTLRDISLQVKEKKFVGIIGANGCGKSTLLKNIYRFLKPKKGKIKVNSIFIEDYSSKEIAKKISVLAQKQSMNFDFTIEEIVEMGRYAHQNSIFKNEINNDIVKDSLQAVGMYDMRKRSFLTLSGGEMQRIFIARTLAQNTDILILDEPTNHLDIKYQLQRIETELNNAPSISDENIDKISTRERREFLYFSSLSLSSRVFSLNSSSSFFCNSSILIVNFFIEVS